MPFIYLPKWQDSQLLVDNHGPRTGRPKQDQDRRELIEDGYVAMQVLSERLESGRTLSHEDVMECLKGREWALRALLAPLSDGPPLLHRGCEPCPIEGCSNCMGAECVCSTGKQYPDTEFRICLNLNRP